MRADRRPLPRRYPRAPLVRRVYAIGLDFAVVWLTSLLLGGILGGGTGPQIVAFILGWLGMRVWVAGNYRGQSLGRWAFDLTLIDARDERIPDLKTLLKREGILGGALVIALLGFRTGSGGGPLETLLCLSPAIADFVIAVADEDYRQAFHDRIAQTLVLPSKRGYSLDMRLRRWLDRLQDRWDERR